MDILNEPTKHVESMKEIRSRLYQAWGKVPRPILAADYLGDTHARLVEVSNRQPVVVGTMLRQVADGFGTAIAYVSVASAMENQIQDLQISSIDGGFENEIVLGNNITGPTAFIPGYIDGIILEDLRRTLVGDPTGFLLLEEYLKNFKGSPLNERGAKMAGSIYKFVYPLTRFVEF